ncbi:hypothetical protein [Caballeronia sp. GaOx3]|uniref:hypothetical protein n=1 Tax=Caballeronia sp. GaOx3 TaxID=2921740 RepID=UPI002028B6E2|nr:hypothetical protein [Caballeronia sp. GaOx3]
MNLISVAGWVVGLLGFGLLVAGVMLMSVPVGLIVAGVLLLFWAYLADRAAAGIIARASQAKE